MSYSSSSPFRTCKAWGTVARNDPRLLPLWGRANSQLFAGPANEVPPCAFGRGYWEFSHMEALEHPLTFGENGRTSLVKFPGGWKGNSGRFSADLELFCLRGRLRIGSYVLDPYCYSYIPAGKACGEFQASEDTEVLWMVNANSRLEDEGHKSVNDRGFPSSLRTVQEYVMTHTLLSRTQQPHLGSFLTRSSLRRSL